MAEKNQTSLMKKVNTLCKNSNLNELYLNDNNSSTYIKNIQLTTRVELTSHQYNLIRNNQKLKFYSIFKKDCHKSHCLNIITNIREYKSQKTLNKFRLGNHRLQIKWADIQYRKLQKIFEFAPSAINEVEHEVHFLFNFNLYDHVFDLTFTETLVIDTPFLIILKTRKKPSS